MYVLDASVIAKWFVMETDTDKAISFLNRFLNGEVLLAEPDLLIYEIGNVFIQSKAFSVEEIGQALQSLYDLNMQIVTPVPPLAKVAVELADSFKLSYYDATYLALAKELGMTLITADRKLFERTNSLDFVFPLSEFE